MKTSFNLKNPLRCERALSRFSFWPCWPLALGPFSSAVRTMKSSTTVRALKDRLAGLAALPLTLTVNARLFLGLVMMGVVAPLAACAYMVFNRGFIIEHWYHVNYFHLFFLLGPHLFNVACFFGIFLLFPRGSKRAYFIAIPFGYTMAKILWLIQVSDNKALWSLVPSSFILGGMAISVVLLLIMDWLSWRKFHRADAFDARLNGLAQVADDLPAEKVKSMFLTTWREKKEFQKQY